MPSDTDIQHIIDLAHSTGTKIGWFTEDSNDRHVFTEKLLSYFRKVNPNVNTIYCTNKGFNLEININYIIITDSQMDTIVRQERKYTKDKADVLETTGLKQIFIGVHKDEGEPLTSVTDIDKICFGIT